MELTFLLPLLNKERKEEREITQYLENHLKVKQK